MQEIAWFKNLEAPQQCNSSFYGIMRLHKKDSQIFTSTKEVPSGIQDSHSLILTSHSTITPITFQISLLHFYHLQLNPGSSLRRKIAHNSTLGHYHLREIVHNSTPLSHYNVPIQYKRILRNTTVTDSIHDFELLRRGRFE